MKMKEKKNEEIVEEVVNTSKISDELKEYLEFARYCVHQHSAFAREDSINDKDWIFEQLGIDTSKPVSVLKGFSKETVLKEYDEFIQSWIDRYNELDLNKIDNYTNSILHVLVPIPWDIMLTRKQLKKCAQPITEK